MHHTEYDTRLAAYVVIVDDAEQILLSWFNGNGQPERAGWSLPGGGVEFGESLEEAAVREVKEETGYDVELGDLLLAHVFSDPDPGRPRPFQGIRIVYSGRIVDGVLGTLEVGGSTDYAAWRPLDDPAIMLDSTGDIVRMGIEALRGRAH